MKSWPSTAVLYRGSCTTTPGTSSRPPAKAPSSSSSANPAPRCDSAPSGLATRAPQRYRLKQACQGQVESVDETDLKALFVHFYTFLWTIGRPSVGFMCRQVLCEMQCRTFVVCVGWVLLLLCVSIYLELRKKRQSGFCIFHRELDKTVGVIA